VIAAPINQNGASDVMHRLDENPATDKREIGVPFKQWADHLFDLRGRGHRRGFTSVTIIRCVLG
jgi:hypothetical protein